MLTRTERRSVGDQMKRISPLDHAWLLLESRDTPMHVGGLFEYTKPPEGAAPDYLTQTLSDVRSSRRCRRRGT